MHYVIKYKLFFHTFNKEIEDTVKVGNGLSYFNGERIIMFIIKLIEQAVRKLLKVVQIVYNSESG